VKLSNSASPLGPHSKALQKPFALSATPSRFSPPPHRTTAESPSSAAWGRNSSGQIARTGGWGYLLGDEGSGYAIALAGLRAAMRAADGRGPPTDLLTALMQKLAVELPEQVVAKVYSPEMTRDRLAELASVVFDFRSTDKPAEAIVTSAVDDLAEMVVTVASQLRLEPKDFTLAMAGGVLVHQLNYVEFVVYAVAAKMRTSRPAKWMIVEEPVSGAVALARAMAS
jgi:N-acetylmuramic acid 6-phosphate etherase